MLALATSQDGVDQTGRACMAEQPYCFDCFGDGRVRGNIRVQQLTQSDDGERAHVRIELLPWTCEQTLEQCVEAEIPANAVVDERAKQTALLARRLRVERQRIERAAGRRHVRNDLRGLGTYCGRAAHEPSTAPSRRCAL